VLSLSPYTFCEYPEAFFGEVMFVFGSRSQLSNALPALYAGLILLLVFAPHARATQSAYITNSASHNVSVINTTTNTVTATIPVGPNPTGVAVHPAGTRVYVVNQSGDSVSVVDTAANTVITTVPVGSFPTGVAVNPAGTRIYVTNQSGNNVSVIDAASNAVVATVAVGLSPVGVAVNPAGTRVYVANQSANNVTVVDAASNSVIATVPVGASPAGVVVNPAGSRAYITNYNSNTLSVLDTASNTVITSVAVGSHPVGVAVDPTGTRLYVANQSGNTVSVLDARSNTVIGTVAVGTLPVGVAFNAAGTRVYVTNYSSDTVSVLDTASNTVIGTVAVGYSPSGFGLFVGGPPETVVAVEYYYQDWNFYFETAFPDEIAVLDNGAFGGAFRRTGQTFMVWPQTNPAASPTCRFFTVAFPPKSSHFYTPFASECAFLKTQPAWQYEGIAFYIKLADANGLCSGGTIPLYRFYNNGMGGAPNHRYTTSLVIFDQMVAAGWTFEGNGDTKVFACVPQ
jgi:YVTN family beta-propeller protein